MIAQFMDQLEAVRISVFRADAMRSLAFIAAGAGLLFLLMRRTISVPVATVVLFALVLLDMWPVNKRYLNNEKERGKYVQWEDPADNLFPYAPSTADLAILENEAGNRTGLLRVAGDSYENRRSFEDMTAVHEQMLMSRKESAGVKKRALSKEEQGIASLSALNFQSNFRVLNMGNPFNDGQTPYFHKSVGGYHGAKLQRIQDMIDFHLRDEIAGITNTFQNEPTQAKIDFALMQSDVLNMLNTRYIIYNPSAPPIVNRSAFGAAWVVNEVSLAEGADEEITVIGEIDPAVEAVADQRFAAYFNNELTLEEDSLASVRILSYKPNELVYDFSATRDQFVVFSEIHYDAGWQAYLNDEPVDHIRVNYLLRGMKVPAGNHSIVFRFEPDSFYRTANVATGASVLTLLLFAFALFREFKRPEPETGE
jgi:hypothetical protein